MKYRSLRKTKVMEAERETDIEKKGESNRENHGGDGVENNERKGWKREMGKRAAAAVLTLCLVCGAPTLALAAEQGSGVHGIITTGAAAVGGMVAMRAADYTNPGDIIIQAPSPNYTTTARQISIYGACDYNYPLYMNGKQVTATGKGFFAEYVTLDMGKNTFTFTNNGKTKSVTVTRKQPAGGGGTSSAKINIWGADAAPKYGIVEGHNISRMASPGTDGEKLLMPLAKGTVAQLTGDSGKLYRLSDGTFVYKSNVKVTEGRLDVSHITETEFVPQTEENCTEVRFRMDQNALYNLELLDDTASLTVYNTVSSAALPEISPNKIIKSVTMLDGGGENTVYSLSFRDNAPINGYYVEFSDGWMKVGFKQKPLLNGTDLTGVRIHIDAGHGGGDTGSLGAAGTHGPEEKDITLSIALQIQSYLESKGATVLMTRTDDTGTGLSARAYQVAMEKPDLCLSVHCNSMPVTANYNNSKGMLTFYSLDHRDAAAFINEAITKNMGIEMKAPRHSNLAMTRMTDCPSVLFEAAFMSNPADYQWLIARTTQEQFGQAAGRAVESYINTIGILKDVGVIVNGTPLQMDQPPVMQNGRVLIPFKAVFEALGAEVSWEPDTRTVTAQRNDTQIKLVIDSRNMSITENGTERNVALDAAPQIINGRTLVPGRAAAEALSAEVSWDGATRTVIITQ